MAIITALTPRSSRQSRAVALDNGRATFLCVIIYPVEVSIVSRAETRNRLLTLRAAAT
jgi:hypothetical protein